MTKVVAANAVAIGAAYSQASTFGPWQQAMTKLDAFVNGTDAVFQLLTDPTQQTWDNMNGDPAEEVLMRMGFNGRDPLPAFYAVRFKVWSGTLLAASGTIDFAAYAI